jgi:hypothetical protein
MSNLGAIPQHSGQMFSQSGSGRMEQHVGHGGEPMQSSVQQSMSSMSLMSGAGMGTAIPSPVAGARSMPQAQPMMPSNAQMPQQTTMGMQQTSGMTRPCILLSSLEHARGFFGLRVSWVVLLACMQCKLLVTCCGN